MIGGLGASLLGESRGFGRSLGPSSIDDAFSNVIAGSARVRNAARIFERPARAKWFGWKTFVAYGNVVWLGSGD